MEKKYTSEVIYAAVDFMRACRAELGDAFTDERVNAMFDAFDPALKSQILMEMMLGNIGQVSLVQKDFNTHNLKKITAIKAIRALTGWGLKESKEFIDDVGGHPKRIPGNFTLDMIRAFREMINDSGYSVK